MLAFFFVTSDAQFFADDALNDSKICSLVRIHPRLINDKFASKASSSAASSVVSAAAEEFDLLHQHDTRRERQKMDFFLCVLSACNRVNDELAQCDYAEEFSIERNLSSPHRHTTSSSSASRFARDVM